MAVAVNDVHGGERAEAVAEAIRRARGVAGAFGADVTDEDQVARLVSAVGATLGLVNVLVLNATGPQPEAPVADVSWEDHLDQLAFFVKSPVLLLARCCRGCASAGSAASSRSTRRWPTSRRPAAPRTRRRRARRSASRAPGRAARPLGITVNAVSPGFIPVERHADVNAAVRRDYVASVPAGRMGTPEELAHAVSFFACEDAGFVTGQHLVVDGGRSLGR